MTEPVLQFRHHMYGADIGAIRVQWVQAGENFWSNPMSPYTVTLADEKDPWSHYELNLSAQAGNIIKIRFIAQKSGLGVAADIAFDDIAIFDRANIDVGVDRINTPGARINMTGGPAGKRFKITLRNFGKQDLNNIPISYTVTPTCGPNSGVSTTYTFTHPGSIYVGTEQVAVDATNTVAWPKGSFEVYAWTTKNGDNNSWNDSAYTRSTGWPEQYIQGGFVEDFENCSLGDTSGFFASGDLNIFKTGSITALGGNNGYASRVNMVAPGGVEEYLYFPRFIGFDTIAGAELRITHDVDLGAGDVALIETPSRGTMDYIRSLGPSKYFKHKLVQHWLISSI